MMYPLSREIDFFHNLRIEYGMISTMPFGFIRANSTLDKEPIRLMPGHLIPIADPQRDVFFPNLGNRTAFGFQEEQACYTLVERLTGISDVNLGAVSGKQGALRTATGARALIAESNTNLNVFLRRFQDGWRKALKFSLDLLQQRIPVGMSFRVTGDDGFDYWRTIRSRDDIGGDFDFEMDANTANSNPAIQQEMSQFVFNLTQNPILLQTQIVSVQNIYEATKGLLKAYGVKDFGKFCTAPQNGETLLEPKEELSRVINGIPVNVTPSQNHQGFIALVGEVMNNDELLGTLSPEQTKLMIEQAQKHRQMMQAMQQAEAQARNLQQVQMNAQMGSLQSGGQSGGTVGAPQTGQGGLPQNPEL